MSDRKEFFYSSEMLETFEDFLTPAHYRIGIRSYANGRINDIRCKMKTALKYNAAEGKSNYENIGAEIGRLVAEKQVVYGDSFGKAGDVLRIICPEGITPEKYNDMLAVIRIIDKCFRILNRKDAFSENPYRDIAGYGLLGAAKDEKIT